MTPFFLYNATLVIVGLLVFILVVYLVAILIALRKAGNHLLKLAGGLQKISDDTSPLSVHLSAINDALHQLHGGLTSVNKYMTAIARIMKL